MTHKLEGICLHNNILCAEILFLLYNTLLMSLKRFSEHYVTKFLLKIPSQILLQSLPRKLCFSLPLSGSISFDTQVRPWKTQPPRLSSYEETEQEVLKYFLKCDRKCFAMANYYMEVQNGSLACGISILESLILKNSNNYLDGRTFRSDFLLPCL